MRFRRHLPPFGGGLEALSLNFDRRRAGRWTLIGLGTLLAGYLTAYLVLFPAPILPGHQVVPRVLGLSLAEAQSQVTKAGLAVTDGGTEPHPSAPEGTVTWQDPPAGMLAPQGLKVTLVASAGPPKIPIPDVANLDARVAQQLIAAAGLVVSGVDSVQAGPRGLALQTQPAAGTLLTPGAGVTLIVSRGAPSIAVPDLLGMTIADVRTRLDMEGLELGSVTRRRTPDAPPGTVVAQRPAAGTLAAPGTVIDIVVARSP
jgi:eukaryotic-like serine/threonine-protein kinase